MSSTLVAPIGWPAPGRDVIGGKAAALCRMAGAGLPVPVGAVLTTEAHRAVVDGGEAPVPEGVTEALETALLLAQGMTDSAVAVRSSAPQEDSGDAAYAGMYHTELNVAREDVEGAVRRCWSAAVSPRIAAYAQRRHLQSASGAFIAVIIQRMIRATAAGVLFTADPVSGDPASVYIEAAYGLGETVVRGEVDPDCYRVSRRTREVEIRVGEKATMAVADRSGVRRVAVDAVSRATPVLSRNTIHSLVAVALRVEELFGEPLDIEWASNGEQIFLLQARAITSAAAGRG